MIAGLIISVEWLMILYSSPIVMVEYIDRPCQMKRHSNMLKKLLTLFTRSMKDHILETSSTITAEASDRIGTFQKSEESLNSIPNTYFTLTADEYVEILEYCKERGHLVKVHTDVYKDLTKIVIECYVESNPGRYRPNVMASVSITSSTRMKTYQVFSSNPTCPIKIQLLAKHALQRIKLRDSNQYYSRLPIDEGTYVYTLTCPEAKDIQMMMAL